MRSFEVIVLQPQGRHLPDREVPVMVENVRSRGAAWRHVASRLVSGCRVKSVKEIN